MMLGILGGSFDPPHIGHVLLASYALAMADLDVLMVVPVFQHALGKELTPYEHRLHMCKLAFGHLARVQISTIEQQLGGTSRTLRLIEAFEQAYPGATLRLVVGADILTESHRWQAFDEVRRRAPLLTAGRGGVDCAEIDPRAPVLPDVSSTEIRAALAAGGDASLWVPHKVHAYAEAHRLYRAVP